MSRLEGLKGQEPEHGKMDSFGKKRVQGDTKTMMFWGEKSSSLVDPSDSNRHMVSGQHQDVHEPSPVKRMAVVKTSVVRQSTSVDAFLGGRTKSVRRIRGDTYAAT